MGWGLRWLVATRIALWFSLAFYDGALVAPEKECEAMSKPLIGVNADFRSAKQDASAYTYVASGYSDAILAVGGIPLILPPYESGSDIDEALSQPQYS